MKTTRALLQAPAVLTMFAIAGCSITWDASTPETVEPARLPEDLCDIVVTATVPEWRLVKVSSQSEVDESSNTASCYMSGKTSDGEVALFVDAVSFGGEGDAGAMGTAMEHLGTSCGWPSLASPVSTCSQTTTTDGISTTTAFQGVSEVRGQLRVELTVPASTRKQVRAAALELLKRTARKLASRNR